MDRSKAGIISFALILLILAIFGVEFYEGIWSFPSFSPIPLMVIALVGTGIFVTIKLGFPQLKYFKHGINVTRGIYDNPEDEGDLIFFPAGLQHTVHPFEGDNKRISISGNILLGVDNAN